MSKHTPGPWPVRYDLSSLMQCPGAKANARLIAAAPDLLEACQQMLYHASLGPDEVGNQQWAEDCASMEAAIKKATEE